MNSNSYSDTDFSKSYADYTARVMAGLKRDGLIRTPHYDYHVIKARHEPVYRCPVIIEGYYYDNSHDNFFNKPYVDLTPHDFVITHRTHHISQRRLLRVCSVADFDKTDHYQIRHLVITRMYQARTPLERHLVSHLSPVVNFHNYGMQNSHLTRVVVRDARMDSVLKSTSVPYVTD